MRLKLCSIVSLITIGVYLRDLGIVRVVVSRAPGTRPTRAGNLIRSLLVAIGRRTTRPSMRIRTLPEWHFNTTTDFNEY